MLAARDNRRTALQFDLVLTGLELSPVDDRGLEYRDSLRGSGARDRDRNRGECE